MEHLAVDRKRTGKLGRYLREGILYTAATVGAVSGIATPTTNRFQYIEPEIKPQMLRQDVKLMKTIDIYQEAALKVARDSY